MSRQGNETLRKLLSVLVDGWGFQSVESTLQQIKSTPAKPDEGENAGVGDRRNSEQAKPSAVDIVTKIKAPPYTKQLLLEVASRYEAKLFLPTVADVRNFLETRGYPARQVKQRLEAFRRVLDVLLETPPDRLERIVRQASRSGPSQLGPISDAIRATNASIRSLPSPDFSESEDIENRGPDDGSKPPPSNTRDEGQGD